MPGGQRGADRGQSAARHRVGERGGAGAGERLEKLGQRVHPVAGDHGRRAAGQQVRVHERDRSHQPLVAERLLERRVVGGSARQAAGDHRVLGGLAAGAGSGRHGDERRRRTGVGEPTPDALEVVEHGRAAPEQAGDRLRGVEGRAAADPDHDVGGVAPAIRDCAVHETRARLPGDGQVVPGQAGGLQPFDERRPPGTLPERLAAGHQEHARPVPRRDRRQLRDPARPEDDPRQAGHAERPERYRADRGRPGRERAAHGRSGMRPMKGSARRGSAIQPATAAFQAR